MNWILIIGLLASFLGFIYAIILVVSISKEEDGSDKMKEIASAIREGANAYIKREYMTVSVVAIILAVVIYVAIGWQYAIGFIAGAASSALAGFIGMTVSVMSNVKTANKAKEGMNSALTLAYKGGSVTGVIIISLALFGITVFYLWFGNPMLMIGFIFGASLLSLFARVGGGIYTKGADVGADLVGKVEASIPEDDPRNPAVIADNVGDNVGDCAGMGADLFETYVVTAISAMLIGFLASSVYSKYGVYSVIFPIAIGGMAIIATIIGTFFVKLGKS
ncbi:MAG: sodium/proton-translocating pyrophosphatase, partial [Candidatus Thermoplasmatota archaeon]|nr:sodium/proton-translocating pyrophosphatase [Candidatus Thermoplasmatota archaeon]